MTMKKAGRYSTVERSGRPGAAFVETAELGEGRWSSSGISSVSGRPPCGGDGNDVLHGTSVGTDYLYGEGGNDRLYSRSGSAADTLSGGAGDDFAWAGRRDGAAVFTVTLDQAFNCGDGST
jgi:hypothetical protein